MSNYTPSYMAVSKILYQTNEDLIKKWSQDNSNPELAESCKMLMDAARQEKKWKKGNPQPGN
jgi:hypothetical protein